jgi:hypothetical protein
MMYLVIIDYGDDVERKRVDYVIEKWKDRGFEKAKGIVVRTDENDIGGFIDELYSKISAGRIEVYKSEKEEPSPEKMIESHQGSIVIDPGRHLRDINYESAHDIKKMNVHPIL